MKKFIRHKKKSIEMDIAPLLDIMFMLLLFFLLTYSFTKPTMSLKLPEASNKEVVKKRDTIVSVDKNGEIYLDNDLVNIETLPAKLKQKLIVSKKRRIIFNGDESLLYKNFVEIMDIIKSSGAREILIAHEYK